MAKSRKDKEALEYHAMGRPGKIEVIPTKPYSTQRDLSLAYSPGVAVPCMEIHKKRDTIFDYTSKGNLVAVITNGTAVLGLGNIGPEAAKPVMEGKGLLFKIFADIDVFDIELDAKTPKEFIAAVKALAPTFGGINLEDIKAPECFEIEQTLKSEIPIPIMHDDQHGTAIITGAALLNALELTKKKIKNVKLVVNGAGPSAIACTKLYLSLGVKKENVVMLDSKGVIYEGRGELSKEKQEFATKDKVRDLKTAIKNADVFLGLSRGGLLTKAMVKTMAKNPIVFALANPDPEISYKDAVCARKDVIVATGRSDNPNQVNNVICFPFLFRGALDVRATAINEEMKLAAVYAIAKLAKESVPESVMEAYGEKSFSFGKEYIIPKPLDSRLLTTVSPAVAKAAMDSGVAQKPIVDMDRYIDDLSKRMGSDNRLMRKIAQKAKRNPQRVVFAEADNHKILKAAQVVHDEGIAEPILLGNKRIIEGLIKEYGLDLKGIEIINPRKEVEKENRYRYADVLFENRKRKGITLNEARHAMHERNYYGAAMVELGDADVMISGLTRNYAETIRPALQVIGRDEKFNKLAGMYIVNTKKGPYFLADTTINFNPTAEEIADISVLVNEVVTKLGIQPRLALLTYSNFGSSKGGDALKMREAVKILQEKHPEIIVDGEVQANFALNKDLLNEIFPFSVLAAKAPNTLIFPNLSAGNVAYKLMQEMGGTEAVGPVLLGMKKPVHILQLGSSVREIINMVSIAVTDAQTRK